MRLPKIFRDVFGFKGILEGIRDSVIGTIIIGAILILSTATAAIWKTIQREPVPWTIFILVSSVGVILILIAILRFPRVPILTVERQQELQERKKEQFGQIADDQKQHDTHEKLIDIIWRRVAEIEQGITDNLGTVGLAESLNIEPEVLEQTQNSPRSVESVEAELIEKAYAIDRDRNWPAFRQMGVAVKRLNDGIAKYNKRVTSALSHELLRQVEGVRKIIVVIRSEQATHGDSAELKDRRQKLQNLLAKRERLDTAESSPGFDMNESRRRTERFIDEVRADIKRLENEQS